MITINLQYKILWLTRNLKRKVPTSWSEITPRQLIAIGKNYLQETSEEKMLSVLTNVPVKLIKRLSDFERFKIAEQLMFMTDFRPISSFIIAKAGIFRAPQDRLKGMTFGQFMFIDIFYADWLKTQKDDDLNKFFVCLYLPKGRKFKSENIDMLKVVATKIPLITKCAVSINYRLVKEFLILAYPSIFQKPGDESNGKRQPKGDDGWIRILESIVGDDITNQDKYLELPVHNVLRFIARKLKENAKKT